MQGVHNAIRMVHVHVMRVNARAMNTTLDVDSVIATEHVVVIVVSVVATVIMLDVDSVIVMVHVHVIAVNARVMDTMLVALVNVILTPHALATRLNVPVMGMLQQLVLVTPLVNV